MPTLNVTHNLKLLWNIESSKFWLKGKRGQERQREGKKGKERERWGKRGRERAKEGERGQERERGERMREGKEKKRDRLGFLECNEHDDSFRCKHKKAEETEC